MLRDERGPMQLGRCRRPRAVLRPHALFEMDHRPSWIAHVPRVTEYLVSLLKRQGRGEGTRRD
jgi:hypothetical protein